MFFAVLSADLDGAALSFLVGEWSGSGWIMLGRDNRSTFSQTESVRTAAGGSILTVEGLGLNPEGRRVHQAFAVEFQGPRLVATDPCRIQRALDVMDHVLLV